MAVREITTWRACSSYVHILIRTLCSAAPVKPKSIAPGDQQNQNIKSRKKKNENMALLFAP